MLRRFDAIAPNILWRGDMTEIDTDEGKLHLASVHDAFPRRALRYAMGDRHDTTLVSAALQMAIATRGGQVDGVIFHTDRGSEYNSEAFRQLCGRWGVVQSMGRVGSALDNAAAESFHSVLKVEYVHRHRFATRAEARLKTATWIANFYCQYSKTAARMSTDPCTAVLWLIITPPVDSFGRPWSCAGLPYPRSGTS